MSPRLLLLPLLGSLACASAGADRVGSGADGRMRTWSSELEQLTVQARVEGSAAACGNAPRMCALATDICGLSTSEPSRITFQERCREAQEGCASFRRACTRISLAPSIPAPSPRSP